MCQGLRIGHIVYRHHLDAWMVVQEPEEGSAYAAEAIYSNGYLFHDGAGEVGLVYVLVRFVG